jgi:hypothetical protein
MTMYLSHEIAEAVTDPFAGTVTPSWRDSVNPTAQNEIGDLAANLGLMTEPSEGIEANFGMLDGNVVQYLFANEYTYPGTGLTVQYDAALPSQPATGLGTPGVGLAFTNVFAPTSGGGPLTAAALTSGIHARALGDFSFSGPVATFLDNQHPGTDPSIYQVTIDWGDGSTSLGDVTYDANLKQFIVSSSHTFAQPAGTTADITLQLLDTTNGNVAGREAVVPLQAALGPPAEFAFDAATYAANRNGSQALITVTRTGDTSLQSTVDFHVGGGTAVAGVDYRPVAGTLVFMPGQTVQVVTVPIFADPAQSADQSLNLYLSFATGHAVLGAQATAALTIHPSADIFAPPAPRLDGSSDLGPLANDRLTASNGSKAHPLTLELDGVSVANGLVQLYDVTDPAHPVPLGAVVQAHGGAATITLDGQALAGGVHRFAYTVTAGSAHSTMSLPLDVTIDALAPSSRVHALPARSPASFTVRWSGQDSSGVSFYDVYVSDNGGPFTLLLGGTTATSTTFHGQPGHTYGFYSVATDAAGNAQAPAARAQAVTQVASAGSLVLHGPSSATVWDPYTLTLPVASAANGTIRGWRIAWGDGSVQSVQGTPAHLVHRYATPGAFAIRATALLAGGPAALAPLSLNVHAASSGFGPAPDAFVTTLYREVLNRYPERAGLAYWSGRLASHAPPLTITKGLFRSRERHLLALQGRAPRITVHQALHDAQEQAWGVLGAVRRLPVPHRHRG